MNMTEKIKTINVEETASTIDLLRQYEGDEGEQMTVVTAGYQTAGRGQGGNSWESERNKNLLLGIKLRPKELPATRQYALTEACALAVRDAVAHYTGNASVKWPNDVYVGDRKISGTLSECTISGTTIKNCILGTGINVNQKRFTSDAPNPVSLCQITGMETDLREVLAKVTERLWLYIQMVNAKEYDRLHHIYMGALYRKDGYHRYMDAGGEFIARIETVEPSGLLVLQRNNGRTSTYGFKEVKFMTD